MQENRTPVYDESDNSTGCCPRFKPDGWNAQDLHFKEKLFVKACTKSVLHVPIDMGTVFSRTFKAIEDAHAQTADQFLVLSRELSPWSAEHYFAVVQPVPGMQMERLSGNYRTKVFEGPYKEAADWAQQLQAELAAGGQRAEKIYFFYTTCPKCAKAYGRNYVVGVAQLAASQR
jgi:hypothetical protein